MKLLHCIPMLMIIQHLDRGDSEYSHSLRRSSHYCSTTCSILEYFKIICPYDSAGEVENEESRSLPGSSFFDSRTERPQYWDLSGVAKKNREWVGCVLPWNSKNPEETHDQEEALIWKKFRFCTTITLSCTPLPLAENFWKKEKLKFPHTLCTVPIFTHAIFGFLET